MYFVPIYTITDVYKKASSHRNETLLCIISYLTDIFQQKCSTPEEKWGLSGRHYNIVEEKIKVNTSKSPFNSREQIYTIDCKWVYNLVAREARTQCVNRAWVLASCKVAVFIFTCI